MGASISKAKGSKASLNTIFEKSTTRRKNNLSSCIRVEPATTINMMVGHKSASKDNRKRMSTSNNKKKRNVTKSIISRPSDFIHLNHAGIDYKSFDAIYIPVEQAQIIHITTANTNYATDHSYRSAKQRLDIEQDIKSNNRKCQASQKNYDWAESRQINYDNIFSQELYSITHDSELRPGETRVAMAY